MRQFPIFAHMRTKIGKVSIASSSANYQDLNNMEQFQLFETDLFTPEYKEGLWGQWKINKVEFVLDHGYFSGIWLLNNLAVLLKMSEDSTKLPETWMSLSAYEIESQEIGCRNSFGHTVVAGLGMGWSTINAALNPDTTKISVLEIDKEVISLIEELNVFGNIDEKVQNKISVFQTDALKWESSVPVDFLFIDIWAKHAEAAALDHVRTMQNNLHAKRIYFWGQEIIIYNEAKKIVPNMDLITNEMINQTIDNSIKLPLLIPTNIDYSEIINSVIKNRISRKLPLSQ
jgi:hypothetical protein